MLQGIIDISVYYTDFFNSLVSDSMYVKCVETKWIGVCQGLGRYGKGWLADACFSVRLMKIKSHGDHGVQLWLYQRLKRRWRIQVKLLYGQPCTEGNYFCLAWGLSIPVDIHRNERAAHEHPRLESNSPLNEFFLYSSEICYISRICLLCKSKESGIFISAFSSVLQKTRSPRQCHHLLGQPCKLNWKKLLRAFFVSPYYSC